MLRGIITIFLLISCARAMALCDVNSVRNIHGVEPLASALQEAAMTEDIGAWADGEFSRQDFSYLGDFTTSEGKLIYVAYLETIWGSTSCRGTYRLVFFNSDLKQIGQYKGIEKPKMTGQNELSIPYEDRALTRWVFRDELPQCLEVANDCFPLQYGDEL